MQLTLAPTALPGHCLICRSPNREWFIDTMISIDHDGPLNMAEHVGAVYICCECFKEMAQLARWIPPGQYTDLERSEANLMADNMSLSTTVSGLKNALRELASAGYAGPGSFDDTPVYSLPDDEAVSVGEDELGTREGTTPESSNDEGVDKLRPDGSGDETIFRLNL